jgi:hypothetical protein
MACPRAAFCAAALASVAVLPVATAEAKSSSYRVTYASGLVQIKFEGNGSTGLVKHTLTSVKPGGSISYDPSTGRGSGSFPADALTTATVGSCSDSVKIRRERLELAPRPHRREEIRFAPAPNRARDILATDCAAPGLSDLDASQLPVVRVMRQPFVNDTIRLHVRFSGPIDTGKYTGRVQLRLRLVLRRSTNTATGR